MPRAYSSLPRLRFETTSEVIHIDEKTRLVPAGPRLEIPHLVRQVLSPHDASSLSESRPWLVTEVDGPELPGYQPEQDDPALGRLSRALMALQILTLRGVSPRVAWVEYDDGGDQPSCRRVETSPPLVEPTWARVYDVTPQDLAALPRLVSSMTWASGQHRMSNPVAFLTHGLTSSEPMIRTLLFTCGLDLILGAAKRIAFETRLVKLLGANTPVFPKLGWRECQPRFTVSELAETSM